MKQVAPTSTSAYYNRIKPLVEDPQSKLILQIMEQKENWTNKELALEAQIDASTIAARINRLKKLELVRECGKRICHVTGMLVKMTKLVPRIPSNYSLF